MPQCKKCGKSGLFLKMEKDTGLCLSCNEGFAQEGKVLTEKIMEAKNKAAVVAQEGKVLTEKIMEAKNKAAVAKDPEEIAASCKAVEDYGNELLALHQAYNLQPSQALLDLIEVHKKMREEAGQ
jgi:hypothetical protein